jgi:hypothetical protein
MGDRSSRDWRDRRGRGAPVGPRGRDPADDGEQQTHAPTANPLAPRSLSGGGCAASLDQELSLFYRVTDGDGYARRDTCSLFLGCCSWTWAEERVLLFAKRRRAGYYGGGVDPGGGCIPGGGPPRPLPPAEDLDQGPPWSFLWLVECPCATTSRGADIVRITGAAYTAPLASLLRNSLRRSSVIVPPFQPRPLHLPLGSCSGGPQPRDAWPPPGPSPGEPVRSPPPPPQYREPTAARL